jgi:hypothetical protein
MKIEETMKMLNRYPVYCLKHALKEKWSELKS